VLADPRASWTPAEYRSRNAFVSSLNDELSAIDTALNRLDALRRPASPALRRDIARVYAQFTSGVVNSEDDQLMPDRLRERLTILQGVISMSQGPPLPPYEREAAAIHAQFETAMTAYRAFLTAHQLPPDPQPTPCTTPESST
jgi:hypothetical protein